MSHHEPSQQDFLRAAKATLDVTWDQLADLAGIAPRALKNYRMPDESAEHRGMPALARRAVQQLLDEHYPTRAIESQQERLMKAFKTDEGKWYVSDAAGNVIAGPFDDEGQALDWIEDNRPAPRPRVRP